MDQELKQRLIGAVVVTALAAIFIPMLFDDPVDNSGREVSELTIPDQPATAFEDTAGKLPSSSADVTGIPENGQMSSNSQESDINPEGIADGNREEEAPITENEQLNDEKKWIEESAGKDEQPLEEIDNNQAETVQTASSESTQNKTSETPPPPASEDSAKLAKAGPAQSDSGLVRYYIQAGFFGKKANAESLWKNLSKQGFHAFIETVPTAKGPFYRLKVGPELDKKRAAEIQAHLNQQKIKSFIISE